MHHTLRVLTFMSILAATGAAMAADPGANAKWRITTSMTGMGMSMPARVVEMCISADKQNQPPPSGQGECQYTQISRSGATVSYSVQCRTMKGTGQITYSADRYSGKFDLQSDQGALSATYEGEKIGSCDLSESNTGSAAPSAMSAVGSQVKSGVVEGAGEVKAAAADVATDATQAVKDEATQSVTDKAVNALKGLFGR